MYTKTNRIIMVTISIYSFILLLTGFLLLIGVIVIGLMEEGRLLIVIPVVIYLCFLCGDLVLPKYFEDIKIYISMAVFLVVILGSIGIVIEIHKRRKIYDESMLSNEEKAIRDSNRDLEELYK